MYETISSVRILGKPLQKKGSIKITTSMELRPISTAAVTLQTPDKGKPSHAVSME